MIDFDILIHMKKDPKQFDWNFVGLDFGNWEEELLWVLDLPTTKISISELGWHLDCPFWEHDNGERYTVTLRDVLEKEEGTIMEQESVRKADTTYPIDIYFNKDKWLILDGLHRLVKLYEAGAEEVSVRIVPDDKLSSILSGEPIEMPSW